MTLSPSQEFLDRNELDSKAPVYIAYFPELDEPYNEIMFSTAPLPFITPASRNKVILQRPTSLNQQIIPEEGKASISAVSLKFVDLDGYFTSFISLDTASRLHNRKAVILAGYAGMNVLEDFLPVYTGRVKNYSESAAGLYLVEINDAQKALQRKLFRGAADDPDDLLDGGVIANPNDASDGILTVFPPPDPGGEPEMDIDQFKGQILTIKTGTAIGRKFYIDSNSTTAFILREGLYETPVFPLANLWKIGVRIGNLWVVTPHPSTLDLYPREFYGNPINMLLMWLTTSDRETPNGPYDLLDSRSGIGIDYEDIDIERFEYIRDTYFPGDSHNMHFRITERATAKSFMEGEIFKVLNLYPVLRGDGKLSVAILKPPLPTAASPDSLDEKSIVGTPKWMGNLQEMINEIAFLTNNNGEEFLLAQYFISGDSFIDRGEGKKELKIESTGLKDNIFGGGRFRSEVVRRRVNSVFNRFAIPPIKVTAKARFDKLLIEAGDSISFSHHLTPDIENGVRGQAPILMEVQQRSIDWNKGSTSFTLLDTGYEKGRYGVVSPSMYVTDGYNHMYPPTSTSFAATMGPPFPKAGQKLHPQFYELAQRTQLVVALYRKNMVRVETASPVTILSITYQIPVPSNWVIVNTTDMGLTPELGWIILFDDYDAPLYPEQRKWMYIADSSNQLWNGTSYDPPFLIVP